MDFLGVLLDAESYGEAIRASRLPLDQKRRAGATVWFGKGDAAPGFKARTRALFPDGRLDLDTARALAEAHNLVWDALTGRRLFAPTDHRVTRRPPAKRLKPAAADAKPHLRGIVARLYDSSPRHSALIRCSACGATKYVTYRATSRNWLCRRCHERGWTTPWPAEAHRRWPNAAWIEGNGPIALVAPCRSTTVSLHPTLEAAERAKELLRSGCGGACKPDRHYIVNLATAHHARRSRDSAGRWRGLARSRRRYWARVRARARRES